MRHSIRFVLFLALVVLSTARADADIVSFGSAAEEDEFHFWFTYPTPEIAMRRNIVVKAYLLDDPSRPPHNITDGKGQFSEPLEPPAHITTAGIAQGVRNDNLFGINPFTEHFHRGSHVTYSGSTVNLFVPYDSLRGLTDFVYFTDNPSDGPRLDGVLFARAGESYLVSEIRTIPEPTSAILGISAILVAVFVFKRSTRRERVSP